MLLKEMLMLLNEMLGGNQWVGINERSSSIMRTYLLSKLFYELVNELFVIPR